MKRNLMKEAHKLTKQIVSEYGDVDYIIGGKKEMELKGTEKQIAWAKDIRNNVIYTLKQALELQIAEIESRYENSDEDFRTELTKRFNEDFEVLLNNNDSKFWIENFKGHEKGDGFFLEKELIKLGLENSLCIYLQKMM